MFMYFHRLSLILIISRRFLWIFMDLEGSGARVLLIPWRPVTSCAALCRPMPPDWIPYILSLGGLEAFS